MTQVPVGKGNRWLAVESVSVMSQGTTDGFLTSADGLRKEIGGLYRIN